MRIQSLIFHWLALIILMFSALRTSVRHMALVQGHMYDTCIVWPSRSGGARTVLGPRKGFTHSMVHLWAEKGSLQWVPTFRPASLSTLQNLAPFIVVTASAADCPVPQADLVGVMSGAAALVLSVAAEHLKRWRQGKERDGEGLKAGG